MNASSRVHIKLLIDGCEIEGAVDLPAATPVGNNAPRRLLLPILSQLTDAIVNIAENRAHESAGPVTCSKGCDACCHQMVPISTTEAYALAHLIDSLDPAHAARIRGRFTQNLAALQSAGLLPQLLDRANLAPEDLAKLDRDYFALQLPCPFLEDRACSIHPQRPLTCREFLVTSDPIHCSDPGCGKIEQLQLGAKPSTALLITEAWIPLILSLDHAIKNPEPIPPLPPDDDLIQLLNSLQSA